MNLKIRLSFLAFVLLMVQQDNMTNAEIPMPCSLSWVPLLAGLPLPENSVASTPGTEHFIARARIGFTYVNGRVQNSTKLAYIPLGGYRVFGYYEVLTNPNDCALTWVSVNPGGVVPQPQFAVISGGTFVARGSHEGEQLGGRLQGEFFYVAIIKNGIAMEDQRPGGSAKTLRSTINLKLALTNFVYGAILDDGQEDFLGFDLIENHSNVNVTHSVRHKKSVKNSYSITETNTFSQSSTLSVDAYLPIPGVGSIKYGYEVSDWSYDTESVTVTHTEEKEVVSTWSIVVPADTTIQACSTVRVQTDFPMPYEAVGRYSIKGKSAAALNDTLRQVGIVIPGIYGQDGNAILAKVTGNIMVTVPMKTVLIIVEEGDPNGCKQIQQRISEQKRARLFGTKK